MKRALIVATVMCLGASPALAKPSTTVFPLSAPNLPMKIASAPEELSKALAEELEGDVAQLTLDDAAGLAGCDPAAATCLATVSKNFKTKRLVFGSITMLDEDRLKVTLTRYDPGPDLQQRAFTVEGSVDEMATELIELSRSLFDGSDEEPDPPDPEVPDKPDPKPEGESGSIGGTTYVFLVGGGVATAAGLGFLYSSYQISKEVQAFKPRTEDDFDKLVPLENRGAQRQLIGTILTAAGGAVLVYGIIRAVQDRGTRSSSSEVSRRLTPVPVEGGAALVFSMELP